MPLNLVTAQPDQRLASLATSEVRETFKREGFVVFRGFRPRPEELLAFTDQFTSSYFFGYGRAPFANQPAITTVNESKLALEPHCDNGVRPEAIRPQITWFWCENPASRAGETTFFDGIVVWSRLSPATRAVFERSRIVFTNVVAPAAWRALGHPNVTSFLAFLGTIGAIGRVRDHEIVEVDIATDATRAPRWSPERAFVSSLLVAGSPGFEGMRVSLEGGGAIPAELMVELRAVLESCLDEVAWSAGDLGMLDNTRFLHGRRSYSDPDRRVYLVQTLQASF